MRLSRLDSGGARTYYRWGVNTWTSSPGDWIFVDAAVAHPWSITIPANALNNTNPGDGYRYEVQSAATDNTQSANGGPNTEVLYATSTFILDYSTPTALIQYPADQTTQRLISSLSGIAADPVEGGGIPSGLASIYFELIDTDRNPNKYWNGSAWQTAYSSNAITALENWTISAASLPVNSPVSAADSWAVGRSSATFLLMLKVSDRAGNYSNFGLNYSTFTLDVMIPDSIITSPPTENGFYLEVSSIAGTAADYPVGISSVQISIMQSPPQDGDCTFTGQDNFFWNGSFWENSAAPRWLGVQQFAPGNTATWNYDASLIPFNAYCYYVIKSSASDTVGNGEETWGSRRFKFMPPPAATRVVLPAHDEYYKGLSLVSGTANLNTKRLELEIRQLSDNYYWNFGLEDWQAAVSSISIIPTGMPRVWSQVSSLPPLFSGSSYTFRSVGISFSNVYETGPATNRIYFDTDTPKALVQLPAAAQVYYNTLPRLGGTAQDEPAGTRPPAAGIGASNVWVELKAVNGPYEDQLWDNAASTYTAPAGWSKANNSGTYYSSVSSWTFVVSYPTAAYVNGAQYEARALVRDMTYNDSALTGTESQYSDPITFNYDITVPTAVVTSVSSGTARSGVSVASGTLTEENVLANSAGYQPGMQVQGVKLRIKYNNINQYWTGSGWDSSASTYAVAAVHQSSWSFGVMPDWADDGSYTLWAEATDKAGNVQAGFYDNVSSVTFTSDEQGPTAAVASVQTSTRVAVLASVSGTANDADWLTNSGIAAAGNTQVQISFLLNTVTYYYNNATAFSSGLDDSNSWWPAGSWTQAYRSSGTWTYAPAGLGATMISDRAYTIKVRTRDDAIPDPNLGNFSAVYDVVFDTTPPSVVITSPTQSAILKTIPDLKMCG